MHLCVTYGIQGTKGLWYVLEQRSRSGVFTLRPNALWGDAVVELLHCCSQIEGSMDKYLCGAAWLNYLKLPVIPVSLSWKLLQNSRKDFFLLWETAFPC